MHWNFFERDKVKLVEGLYYCYIPMEEKQRIYCTDSSDKNKIGTYIEVPRGYDEYLVNESEYDIQEVAYRHSIAGDRELGPLFSNEALYFGSIEGWAFDLPDILEWKLYINPILDPIEISFNERYAMISDLKYISALEKKGYKNAFQVR